MSDYKAMYLSLFNSVTDAIEILKTAQIKCEEIYLQSEHDAPFLSAPTNVKRIKYHLEPVLKKSKHLPI